MTRPNALNKEAGKHPVLIIILFLLLGIALAFYLNNKTTKGIYDFGSCTYNKHECNYTIPDWNGECSEDIEDECCIPVRMCGGSTTNPWECNDDYCTEEGYSCQSVYGTAGVFTCECKPVNSVPR